jgi:glycosyltransferase involved in cell wall biosynthesis
MDARSTPLVSIITPVYNGANYLDELIASVRDQDYPAIEHLIIDDGSTDDGATVAILKKYPHLRWWTRENRGQYATMNEGLEAAKGDVICFISADDQCSPNAVSNAIEFMINHPEFGGVYGKTTLMDETGKTAPIQMPFRRAPIKFHVYFTHIAHCSLYLRKPLLIAENLYFSTALNYVGDYDWILRLIETNVKIGFVNQEFSRVRIHTEQTSQREGHKMLLEKEGVVKARRINPFVYTFYSLVYFFVVAFNKLRVTIRQQGLGKAGTLLADWFQRRLHNAK